MLRSINILYVDFRYVDELNEQPGFADPADILEAAEEYNAQHGYTDLDCTLDNIATSLEN